MKQKNDRYRLLAAAAALCLVCVAAALFLLLRPAAQGVSCEKIPLSTEGQEDLPKAVVQAQLSQEKEEPQPAAPSQEALAQEAPAQEEPASQAEEEPTAETGAVPADGSQPAAEHTRPSAGGAAGNQGGSDQPAGTGASTDTGASQPAHQHNWQPHEVWVPNIVTVVDEPEQVVYGAQLYTQHSDGSWVSDGETYWFENGFTQDDFKQILKDKIKNEGYIGNYVNRTKTVPAVTHEEDQGSYQVDYYYCDCGATKPA